MSTIRVDGFLNDCNPKTTINKSIIIGGIFTAIITLLTTIILIILSLHFIDEGNVGVYYRYGALLPEISQPGANWKNPFATKHLQIKTIQTKDIIPPFTAITRDGISNIFKDIEIITSIKNEQLINIIKSHGSNFKELLIIDRVIEHVRTFISNNTINDAYNEKFNETVSSVKIELKKSLDLLTKNISIIIHNLVIPKPDIPDKIANNYEEVKIQWTKKLVAEQKRDTEKTFKDTEYDNAMNDERRLTAISRMEYERSKINNMKMFEQEQTISNATQYRTLLQAQSNLKLLTKDYVQLEIAKTLQNNTRIIMDTKNSIYSGILNKSF